MFSSQKPPSWNDLLQQEFLRFFVFFFQSGTSVAFQKGVLKVILHFIITNGPRMHDMWDGAGLGMRGGMFALQSRLGLHIYSHLLRTSLLFKQGLDFTGRFPPTICPSVWIRQALIISEFDKFDNVSVLGCVVIGPALQKYRFRARSFCFVLFSVAWSHSVLQSFTFTSASGTAAVSETCMWNGDVLYCNIFMWIYCDSDAVQIKQLCKIGWSNKLKLTCKKTPISFNS